MTLSIRSARWLGYALIGLCAAIVHGQDAAEEPTPSGPPPLPAMIQWHKGEGGFQYTDLVIGKGPTPRDGQVVVVHFNGWLDDGAQFDSTYRKKKPFGFELGIGQVIKGWDMGVRGMRPGGKRRLIVPPALGYGAEGVANLVPPNASLVFDIELVSVLDAPLKPSLPPTPMPRRRE